NKAEATQTVLVNDGSFTAGDTYIIKATDFENRISQVDTTNAGILKDAQVKVFDKLTGAEVTVEFTVDKGSYTATAGTYDNVKVTVKDDAAATRVVTATVITGSSPVLTVPGFTEVKEGDTFSVLTGVELSDSEDALSISDIVITPETVDTSKVGVVSITYTIEDSDGNKVEKTQTVLINDGSFTAGDTYIIRAQDFTQYVSQVEVDDAKITSLAQVQVFDKGAGDEVVPLPKLTVELNGYTASANVYNLKVTIDEDTKAAGGFDATVLNDPKIEIQSSVKYIALEQGAAYDLLTDVVVVDQDGKDVTKNANLKVIDNGGYKSNVNGVYLVKYGANMNDIQAEIFTRLIVVGGSIYEGDQYIITANNFERKLSVVKKEGTSREVIIELSEMKVFDRETLEKLDVLDEVIIDDGGYAAKEGVYEISFAGGSNQQFASAVIIGKVIDDTDKNDYVNLGCGVNATWNEDKKMCICDPGYTSWAGAGVGCLTKLEIPSTITDDKEEPEEEIVLVVPTETPKSTPTPTPIPTMEAAEMEEPVQKDMALSNIFLTLGVVLMAILTLLGKNETEDEEGIVRFKVFNVFLAAVSVVALIFIGNFTGVFILVDMWTIGFAGLFIGSLIVYTIQRISQE
ncbi:MAG: immunoglobulin-like domain-containing protein, partial [Anaerorhabdus sp.]